MNYCHECGSEIAQIDTFCPFCGIALQPFNKKEESSETEQDKTVAVNQSEFQDILSPNISEQPEVNDEPESSLKEDSNLEESPKIEKENTWSSGINALDSNFDFPGNTDSKIENFESPNEIEPEKSPDENFEEVEEKPSDEIVENSVEENSESDFNEEAFSKMVQEVQPNDATLVDIPTPQILENKVSEEIESNDSEIEPDSETNDNELKNDLPENQSEEKIEEPISEEQKFEKQNSEEQNSVEIDSIENSEDYIPTVSYSNFQKLQAENAEAENSIVQNNEIEDSKAEIEPEIEIAKPEFPAEEPEIRDTTFDSVRIMDDVKPSFEKPPENISAEQKPESAEKSYTTPNIGVGDTDGRKSAKLKPLDEGTVLNGRYEIVRKIGGGGMGAVYLATDRNLGGILRAVKEMIQSYIEETQQEKAISDFKRESMLLTSLDHPSIPTIYDYFYDEKEGRFYLVMKYISGGDLASRLRAAPEGKIDEESVISWAIQVADVLDYLHNRQPPIVYRDLKPANIMIDGNSGRTMLIDFGIARWVNKEEKGVTAVGTMGYAPPELFSGNVEPSSDIYSLGSTMFHLLTGADPQSNPLLIFDFQKHPRPRQINPQLSDQIEKILLRMVEYNADKRYRTAADVRVELQKHLENLKSGSATFGISKVPSAVAFSEQTVFCGFCGQKIVATDMFCAFCGSRQPLAQQGVHSAEYHLPQATAKLVVIGTNDLEIPTFVIEKDDNLLGRRDPLSNIFPEIDLSKYDPQTKISRRHAHIFRDGNDFMVEDLGSSNGTLVLRVVGDAVKLNPHTPHTLVNGEKIKIGDTTLHFVVG